MALQILDALSICYPGRDVMPIQKSTGMLIDATGEKAAYIGRVCTPNRGSKSLHKVWFPFGSVTKAGGSALTVSLQGVLATSGPPYVPDETPVQTVAIANADANFASNTFYQTAAFSADRTVAHGDLLAIVVEYDAGGRLGADSVRVQESQSMFSGVGADAAGMCALKASGTWTNTGNLPNIVLEFSDGTYGTLMLSMPLSTNTNLTYNSGSTPDEQGNYFKLPIPLKIDGLTFAVSPTTNAADYDIVLYDSDGTTALATVSRDANEVNAVNANQWDSVNFAPVTLQANTFYRAAVRPSTVTNVRLQTIDLPSNALMECWPFGINCYLTTRTDAGAWSQTTTRRVQMALHICGMDDGVGSIVVETNTMLFRSNAAGVAY